MACSVKRPYPFEDGDSLSSSLKRLHCSSSPSRMDSPRSSPPVTEMASSGPSRSAASSSQNSPYPDLSNGDLSQKILLELRKLQHKIATGASRKPETHTEEESQLKDVQPTFSVNQVRLVCSKLLKERENEVRAEYDKVLQTRLAEQYETFVKFAQDHIQSQQARTGEPSYFS